MGVLVRQWHGYRSRVSRRFSSDDGIPYKMKPFFFLRMICRSGIFGRGTVNIYIINVPKDLFLGDISSAPFIFTS